MSITAAPLLNVLQDWPAVSQAVVDQTPMATKLEWGKRFTVLAPKAAQKYGPAKVYDIVCELVRDGELSIRAKLKSRPMGRFEWTVEFRLRGDTAFNVAHKGE